MLYAFDAVDGTVLLSQYVNKMQQNSLLISDPQPVPPPNRRRQLTPALPPNTFFWAAGQAMNGGASIDQPPLWTYETNGKIFMSPALDAASNSLVFGSDDGNLTSVNASTGALLWTVALNISFGHVDWTPTIVAGAGPPTFVIVGMTDTSIRAVDLATGAQRWVFFGDTYNQGNRPDFGFDWGGGIFWPEEKLYFAGCIDGNVYALDALTGALVWSAQTGGPISS